MPRRPKTKKPLVLEPPPEKTKTSPNDKSTSQATSTSSTSSGNTNPKPVAEIQEKTQEMNIPPSQAIAKLASKPQDKGRVNATMAIPTPRDQTKRVLSNPDSNRPAPAIPKISLLKSSPNLKAKDVRASSAPVDSIAKPSSSKLTSSTSPSSASKGVTSTSKRNPTPSRPGGCVTSWISPATQNRTQLLRLQTYALYLSMSHSPYFPSTLSDYIKHQSEWASHLAGEERRKMEIKIGQLELEKKCKKEGKGEEFYKVRKLERAELLMEGFGDNGLGDGKMRTWILGLETNVWASVGEDVDGAEDADGEMDAIWPGVAELKFFGENRIREGKDRKLPYPRLDAYSVERLRYLMGSALVGGKEEWEVRMGELMRVKGDDIGWRERKLVRYKGVDRLDLVSGMREEERQDRAEGGGVLTEGEMAEYARAADEGRKGSRSVDVVLKEEGGQESGFMSMDGFPNGIEGEDYGEENQAGLRLPDGFFEDGFQHHQGEGQHLGEVQEGGVHEGEVPSRGFQVPADFFDGDESTQGFQTPSGAQNSGFDNGGEESNQGFQLPALRRTSGVHDGGEGSNQGFQISAAAMHQRFAVQRSGSGGQNLFSSPEGFGSPAPYSKFNSRYPSSPSQPLVSSTSAPQYNNDTRLRSEDSADVVETPIRVKKRWNRGEGTSPGRLGKVDPMSTNQDGDSVRDAVVERQRVASGADGSGGGEEAPGGGWVFDEEFLRERGWGGFLDEL